MSYEKGEVRRKMRSVVVNGQQSPNDARRLSFATLLVGSRIVGENHQVPA